MANLLIVDDEQGIRELLQDILTDEGHQVQLAENAQQARALHQRNEFDLVLLDIWMPQIDGISLLKEWREQQVLTMPIVMMSGHATTELALEAIAMGAYVLLEKPIPLSKLLQTVAQALLQKPWHMRSVKQLKNNEILQSNAPDANVLDSITAVKMEPKSQIEGLTLNVQLKLPMKDAKEAFEKMYFAHHIQQANGAMSKVAESTGLDRTHLYRKLKQLGLDVGKNRA